MSEDVLSGQGMDRSLSRLLRQGLHGRFTGLDALRNRLRQARRREQERLNLEGPLQEVQQRLNDILETERRTLSFDSSDDAPMREAELDALPADPAGQIKELKDYRFRDQEAQRGFDELLSWLQDQVLGSYFRTMARGLRGVDGADRERLTQMLSDLNDLVDARRRGEDTQEAFERFLQRYGDFFPEHPRTLDELLEQMARRMAALSRFMASLSLEQRAELEALARSVLEDLDLAFQVDRLAGALSDLFPDLAWDEPALAGGDQEMSMQATVDALERVSDYEELDRPLRANYAGAALEDIDEERLRRTLGDQAVLDVRRLKDVERALERAGLVTRVAGRLEVTPRGARKLGERALVRLFEQLRRDREGAHDARDPGGLAEPTGQTRPWRFGETGAIAVQRTVFNAIVRSGPSPRPRLAPEDFELVEAETRTEAATALLLDLSFSMPLRGHWVPAKRMALALHARIEGRYPHDRLYLIGFSDYARTMRPEDLTAAGFERVYGTNMQHAFNLAGRLLADHPRATKQVIMVTDGEPTAHLVDGVAEFNWPPVRATIEATLTEALRLAKHGVTINVFMLEDTPGLAGFMERLARLTNGRVFHSAGAGDGLGQFVIRDYVTRRAS